MNKYELTIVLEGKTTPAKKKSTQEFVEKIVKTNEGKIIKLEDWGLKDLEGKFSKSPSGVFLHFVLELEGKSAKAVSEKLSLESSVLRYLLIRKD